MEYISEIVKIDSATPSGRILIRIVDGIEDLHTKCHSQVDSTPASYSWDARFKSQSGDWLSWQVFWKFAGTLPTVYRITWWCDYLTIIIPGFNLPCRHSEPN
jgi:hypothetical protein